MSRFYIFLGVLFCIGIVFATSISESEKVRDQQNVATEFKDVWTVLESAYSQFFSFIVNNSLVFTLTLIAMVFGSVTVQRANLLYLLQSSMTVSNAVFSVSLIIILSFARNHTNQINQNGIQQWKREMQEIFQAIETMEELTKRKDLDDQHRKVQEDLELVQKNVLVVQKNLMLDLQMVEIAMKSEIQQAMEQFVSPQTQFNDRISEFKKEIDSHFENHSSNLLDSIATLKQVEVDFEQKRENLLKEIDNLSDKIKSLEETKKTEIDYLLQDLDHNEKDRLFMIVNKYQSSSFEALKNESFHGEGRKSEYSGHKQDQFSFVLTKDYFLFFSRPTSKNPNDMFLLSNVVSVYETIPSHITSGCLSYGIVVTFTNKKRIILSFSSENVVKSLMQRLIPSQ